MDISGTALVIGASGIGEASALAFARYGARSIVIADIDLGAASAAAAACRRVAARGDLVADAVSIDVTQQDSVEAAVAVAARTMGGRIDYCVNAAGIGVQLANEVAEASVAEFERMYRVNVTGSFLVLRAASAHMKTQAPVPTKPGDPARGTTRGCIVSLGSASGFVATPNMVQYTAAKHAVLGLTRNAAVDNAAHGIRVNSVCPSWVDTPMVRKAKDDVPGLAQMIQAAVPIGRIASPDEVADAVMFFCSPMSSYATGCNMILDGGTTLSARISG